MNKKKYIGIIIILLVIIIGVIFVCSLIEKNEINREELKAEASNINSILLNTINIEESKEVIEWNEITEDGINEELLFQNVDTNCLEKIATSLQSLSAEIAQKEQDDIEFYLSAGWYRYAVDSPQFSEIINMANEAIKPLYLIIYKSNNQGMYEYLCAMILSELVHFDNEMNSWATSKEFLEKFNQKIIDNRKR